MKMAALLLLFSGNSILKADCCLFLNSLAYWLFSHSSGFVIKGSRCRLTSATFRYQSRSFLVQSLNLQTAFSRICLFVPTA